MVPIAACHLLKRNPQYLTPKQLASLEASIRRDGFTVPILVRPIPRRKRAAKSRGDEYEIVSGNHRYMAAKKIGMRSIPAVIADLTDAQAQRLAINLNLIHGEPSVEQLAPFLAACDDAVLAELHLEDDLKARLLSFDANLAALLSKHEVPDELQRPAPPAKDVCSCPTCGKIHVRT